MSARTNDRSIDIDDAEVGMLGGEGIVGDLRSGTADPAQQGALARVGFADQADVGDRFQFQDDVADLARLTGGPFPRRSIGAALEMGVPRPPLPPRATTNWSPCCFRSLITKPCSASITVVPGGTNSR